MGSNLTQPPLVLLIGQGEGIGDVLGGLAKRASAIPNLRWALFGRGGNSSGTDGQQDGQKQEFVSWQGSSQSN